METRFCVHIVFVANAASKNVNEKIKTQTSSPPFVGGYMIHMQIGVPAHSNMTSKMYVMIMKYIWQMDTLAVVPPMWTVRKTILENNSPQYSTYAIKVTLFL